MKFFHTADWHLGKLVQGVYMTNDQRYILKQFLQAIEGEKPDAVIIAGDLYDRAVPPTEAVHLLDEILETIVMKLKTPVLAVAGNHDSPGRLNFGSSIMKQNGFHIVGNLTKDLKPVTLQDEHGEVHFHLIPYCDPSVVRTVLEDEEIRTHNDAAKKIVERITSNSDQDARHVFVGHAFVTPFGEEKENTSDSERPLSIGGAEYVDAHHFSPFQYTALGHLHQAHYVLNETIRYSGSILKYSISEENHKKGFHVVEMDGEGSVSVNKRPLDPRRDIRTVEATIEELLTHPINEDYVFVRLMDVAPVLSPMEKVRSVYPNAMHVERRNHSFSPMSVDGENLADRSKMSDLDLFRAFYKEVKGDEPTEETEHIFKEVFDELLKDENERSKEVKQKEYISN
ncbi:exonuclease sbcCD subunit D [Virgibacillus profundi]|uniref:Nuclease SbcCD subunit D n=1 Tax=Virgibacillus profundi TaxID=2024555 RepID=A0A2A2IBW6_9BACI|nr:exonuclease SbcCD subunit D [Virgibacillus profundi]PAV28868.1 exonuclease sbcCD subunit D [Virgibacillus profundi]PXY53036.1 exonuclease SbcCD subunit D [Virgibacillus profundi]